MMLLGLFGLDGWPDHGHNNRMIACLPSLSRHYIHNTTCSYAPAVEDGDTQGRQRLGQ